MTLVTMIIAALLAFQSAKGSIDGVVFNAANKPIAGAQVTLMKLPGAGGGVTGGVLIGQLGPINRETATTDASGHFTLRGVAPGSYKAFAVDQQTMQTFFDPAVMQRLQSIGTPVTVGSTATVNADLRVISTLR